MNIGLKLRIINLIMTYIITDPCVGTCDTACVEVCPVDCIHGPDDPEGSGEEAKRTVTTLPINNYILIQKNV